MDACWRCTLDMHAGHDAYHVSKLLRLSYHSSTSVGVKKVFLATLCICCALGVGQERNASASILTREILRSATAASCEVGAGAAPTSAKFLPLRLCETVGGVVPAQLSSDLRTGVAQTTAAIEATKERCGRTLAWRPVDAAGDTRWDTETFAKILDGYKVLKRPGYRGACSH